MTEVRPPTNPVRFVTAASLFDGHDAAINIMRRILQAQGCEVIHLGHDRSVEQVVRAAVQEDVQGVAVSSYQGGHVEYFTYLREMLDGQGRDDVLVYGGGGGVIVAEEIALLRSRGITIFSPEDGQRMGLAGMIASMVAACDRPLADDLPDADAVLLGDQRALARVITAIQDGRAPEALVDPLRAAADRAQAPVLGITGTGGSGKSTLTDELLRRFQSAYAGKLRIAVIAVDPTRRRGGGALLGDRIRMNAIDAGPIFFRSLATRATGSEIPAHLGDVIAACRAAHDLVIVETPGIGQGDAGIVPFVDASLYVMTPEFGAASQLEKIDMLDYADAVAVNKFERMGADDARRDVARQLVRNRGAFATPWEDMPVFGTSAARFADDGVDQLFGYLVERLEGSGLPAPVAPQHASGDRVPTRLTTIVPGPRTRYLAEISATVRAYHASTDVQAALAREAQHLRTAASLLVSADADASMVRELADEREAQLLPDVAAALAQWPAEAAEVTQNTRVTLSGTPIPRVAVPRTEDAAAVVRFLRKENLPGRFPYTAGVFAYKREGEAPARMFAGEGDPARTNRRFHLLAEGQPATRLSTAFDSVTLYGRDPNEQPDVYGKVGTSGVSVATLDDMKELYAGFDLCDPTTSVSMTINGPAPTILAMFLNTAIDQRLDAFRQQVGREASEAERGALRAEVLGTVRGTVQADILKEDQGQNTCIFSTDFSLGCMADVQQWFIENGVRNFYSVSISGYHIAEAGANPITQLAFTLANGFTYLEAYLARGMDIDAIAPSFSFFFSNGMDAEYTVLGRVARRIWAIALRDRYGAGERSQRLKYHVQTSGRSLHAQEMDFNDIRTTLQALCAVYDNCNSLHTNAFDEAVTTPSPQSVRRALAIQLIIEQEWGLALNENPLQGSYVVDELTTLVEEAVLAEFERISERGGVLGAMETGYQRGRIQDESMLYEQRKHDGSLPLIGVNTFRGPDPGGSASSLELARATEAEKRSQVERLAAFQRRHADEAPEALDRVRLAASTGGNTFDALMDAVRVCSLGQITSAFFEVGGQYRRSV